MAYDNIIVTASGTGISRAQFGIPVKEAIDDIDTRINSFEGATKVKEVTTSFNSQTTLQNDPELIFDISPNTSYKIEWCFFHQAPAAADIKWGWVGSWGASWALFNGFFAYEGTGITVPTAILSSNAPNAINQASTGSPTVDVYKGTWGLVSGAVGGTLRPAYAQQVSNATNLNVYIGSWMTVTRVAIL